MRRAFVVAKLDSSEYPSASKTAEENIAETARALKVEFVFGRYDITEETKMKDPEEIYRLVAEKTSVPDVLSTEALARAR